MTDNDRYYKIMKDLIKKKQIGGTHYSDMVIQPIDFINKNKLLFCEANVIKYVCRHRNKNGKEDIMKAIHYLELILNRDYE